MNLHKPFSIISLGLFALSNCTMFLGGVFSGTAKVVEYPRSLTYGRTEGDLLNCKAVMAGRTEGEANSKAYSWRKAGITTGAVVDTGVLLYGFYYAVATPAYLLLGTPIFIPGVWYAAELEKNRLNANESTQHYRIWSEGTVLLKDGACSPTGVPYRYARIEIPVVLPDRESRGNSTDESCTLPRDEDSSEAAALHFCKYQYDPFKTEAKCLCTLFHKLE